MPRRVGAYAKLLSNYASDDAIIAAGEKAELLFVRGLAFCATSDSDGYITDGQLVRIVGAGMRDANARARTLVREGLWQQAEGGYQVRSWTKIHESAEEKGRQRRTDRERKRRDKGPDSGEFPDEFRAEHVPDSDPDSERNADRNPPDSLDCSYVSSSPRTEQSTTEQSRAAESAGPVVAGAVRAYVAACPTPPAADLQAKVERHARRLLAEGHPAELVTTTAANAGRAGWTDLSVQMQRDAANARAAPNGGRPSTTDARVNGAIETGRAVGADLADFAPRKELT